MRLYEEKTGNSWYLRKSANKVPGKFYPLEIDYGDDDDSNLTLSTAGTSSKLAPQIQELVKMIFDIESMKKAMMEFEVCMYMNFLLNRRIISVIVCSAHTVYM